MTDKERIEPKTAEQFDYSQLSADGKIYYWMSEYNKLKRQVSEKDKLISELVGRWEEIKRGVLPLDSFESLIKKASNPEKNEK